MFGIHKFLLMMFLCGFCSYFDISKATSAYNSVDIPLLYKRASGNSDSCISSYNELCNLYINNNNEEAKLAVLNLAKYGLNTAACIDVLNILDPTEPKNFEYYVSVFKEDNNSGFKELIVAKIFYRLGVTKKGTELITSLKNYALLAKCEDIFKTVSELGEKIIKKTITEEEKKRLNNILEVMKI